MEKVKIELMPAPVCHDTICIFRYNCANHITAGELREESGFTPNLKKKKNIWFCDKKSTQNRGMYGTSLSLA